MSAMDSYKALAILAFCASVNAAALPQIIPVGVATSTAATVGPAAASGAAGITITKPIVPAAPVVAAPAGLGVPAAPVPAVPKVGIPDLSVVPAPAVGLPLDVPAVPVVPAVPAAPAVPIPKLPVADTGSLPLPVPVPKLPNLSQGAALDKVVELGSSVLSIILDILSKGKTNYSLPKDLPIPLPVSSGSALHKRQLGGVAVPQPTPGGIFGGIIGGSTSGVTGTVANAVGSVPVAGSAVAPVANTAAGAAGSAGGATGALAPVTGAAGSVGGATGAIGGITGAAGSVGGATGALAPVTGAAGSVTGAAGGVTGAAGGVTGTASGALNTVANTAGNVPVAGSALSGAANTVANTAGVIPPTNLGIPNSDPLGAVSIAVVATLLSLLKKDPLSLFSPAQPVAALLKRDLPEVYAAALPELEHAKRQLPSLSTGLSGVGIGGLPASGFSGIPPDVSFLVSSIAKNIAVPGGNGIGSITSNILGVLNGIVPNFLFQLPVVQDAVPTFGVLQLLSSINPTKFGVLKDLTNLASLQKAAAAIPAADLAFVKGLPAPSDPTNLITKVMNFADNLLTLPGNVANLRASVSALSMKSLGLAVAGL